MKYKVEFKSTGNQVNKSRSTYRDYTVKAQNVLDAEDAAFKKLKNDVNTEWFKKAEVSQIANITVGEEMTEIQ